VTSTWPVLEEAWVVPSLERTLVAILLLYALQLNCLSKSHACFTGLGQSGVALASLIRVPAVFWSY
jgi:hypothetical protein